jgi:DNA-binding XRE family transcriptional regulator
MVWVLIVTSAVWVKRYFSAADYKNEAHMSGRSNSETGSHVLQRAMEEKPRSRRRPPPPRAPAGVFRPTALTPEMIRAGRQVVGWSQAELAERSDLSLSTLQRMERGPARSSSLNLEKLRVAFAAAGVTFTRVGGTDCICCQGAAGHGMEPLQPTPAQGCHPSRRPSVPRECLVIPFRRRDNE